MSEQLQTHNIKRPPTIWRAIGIGIAGAILTTFLGYITYALAAGLNDLGEVLFLSFLAGLIFGSPYGIAGALIGRNWKISLRATWIGAVLGTILGMGSLVMLIYDSWHGHNYEINSPLLLFLLPGIPFGCIGAMIGKYWKQTRLAVWIGSILGAVVGIILLGWLYVWAWVGFLLG